MFEYLDGIISNVNYTSSTANNLYYLHILGFWNIDKDMCYIYYMMIKEESGI